jgi:tetratricopeptide (TPR) repeat protein
LPKELFEQIIQVVKLERRPMSLSAKKLSANSPSRNGRNGRIGSCGAATVECDSEAELRDRCGAELVTDETDGEEISSGSDSVEPASIEPGYSRDSRELRGFSVALQVSIAAHVVLLLFLWNAFPLRQQFRWFEPAQVLVVEWGYSPQVSKVKTTFHSTSRPGGVVPSVRIKERSKVVRPNTTRSVPVVAKGRTLQDDSRQAERPRAGDRSKNFDVARSRPVIETPVLEPDSSHIPLLAGSSPTTPAEPQQQSALVGEHKTRADAPAKVEVGMPVDSSPARKTILPNAIAAGAGASGGAQPDFAEKPFEWYIHHDKTLHGRKSYHFKDGKLVLDSLEKTASFNAHSLAAWEHMESANHAEWQAQTARLRGNELDYAKWHAISREPLEKAISELKQYQQDPENEDPEIVFHTHANLASCFAMLGRADEALKAYSDYERLVPKYWTRAYGHFGLGTIFLVQGDLQNARNLLRRTVTSQQPVDLWYKYNDDPAYRVISWEVLSHIEQTLGDQDASRYSRGEALRCLEETSGKVSLSRHMSLEEFVGMYLRKMGIQSNLMQEFADRRDSINVANSPVGTQ